MNTFWIIVIIVVSLYLLIGIISWLWFAHDEVKHYKKKEQKKIKKEIYKNTFPFIFMWGVILIFIISDN